MAAEKEPITLLSLVLQKRKDEGSWTQWLLDQIVVQFMA